MRSSLQRLLFLATALAAIALFGSHPTSPPTAHAAFPGANGKIAFDSNRDGNTEIYVMNADGSEQTRITNSPATDRLPAWSPDGSNIAFDSNRDGNFEVYLMNADGSGQTRITNNPASDIAPAWSPDGSKIAFASFRDGNSQVYVMNADGSGQTRITNNPAGNAAPAWSPDGSKIAFVSFRDGNSEVYAMNANGSEQTRITNNPAIDNLPDWSPDGSKIAFESSRDGNFEVYVMNADGSDQTRITNNPAPDGVPSWSPDGSKIAFASNRDGNSEVYVMNADGTGQTNVTNNAALDAFPDWQPLPPLVVIDPGHGGGDSGAVGCQGSVEKQLALQVSTLLKENLTASGYSVLLTRETDVNVDIVPRAQFANDNNADAFLSIHINSSRGECDGHGERSEAFYAKGRPAGKAFAADICQAIRARFDKRRCTVKPDTATRFKQLGVLRNITPPARPAALFEVAFIDNLTDFSLLQARTADFAQAIADGIECHLQTKACP